MNILVTLYDAEQLGVSHMTLRALLKLISRIIDVFQLDFQLMHRILRTTLLN